jgi:hypothetical protein
MFGSSLGRKEGYIARLTLIKFNAILAKCMHYIGSLEYTMTVYTNILFNP